MVESQKADRRGDRNFIYPMRSNQVIYSGFEFADVGIFGPTAVAADSSKCSGRELTRSVGDCSPTIRINDKSRRVHFGCRLFSLHQPPTANNGVLSGRELARKTGPGLQSRAGVGSKR